MKTQKGCLPMYRKSLHLRRVVVHFRAKKFGKLYQGCTELLKVLLKGADNFFFFVKKFQRVLRVIDESEALIYIFICS